jgi:ribosomal protein S18 acetylase RimI-like enzyme
MIDSKITLNKSDAASVESHLRECDERFSPRLSARVDLADYACKLASHADRLEIWSGSRLVGLVAAYLNNPKTHVGFVSSVSVCFDAEGRGFASQLIRNCIQLASEKGCESLGLEVCEGDQRAQDLYIKHGFELSGKGRSGFLRMQLNLTDLTCPPTNGPPGR